MNEMYVLTVLMLYTLLVLSETLLNTYRLLVKEADTEDKFIYPKLSFIKSIHTKVTPLILRINPKKDYLLNMKRRPPIILVAH